MKYLPLQMSIQKLSLLKLNKPMKRGLQIDSDEIESEVLVIEEGTMGLYVYSYGQK